MKKNKKASLPEFEANLQTTLNIRMIGIISIVIVCIGLLIFVLSRQVFFADTSVSSAQSAETNVSSVASRVGNLILLPTGETPTLATVSDKTKLQNQPFFKHAENGDKVLIYTNAKEAILYRPSINKIIQVAPLTITNPSETPAPAQASSSAQPQATASATTSAPIHIVIYNGTQQSGLAAATENQLKEKFANIEVTKIGDAKDNYTQTLIVDLTGSHVLMVRQLIGLLGGKSGLLPVDEQKPDADILILLGK